MIFSPFDDDDVITSITDGVIHLVAVVTQVFDKNFLAWAFGSIDGHEEQVSTYEEKKVTN
jgi:hypothetical protein